MTPPLYTIGYEASTLPAVLATLRQAKIGLLIDVRAVAASRKPGFSKRLLAASLAEAGIEYLHLQQLGTPKPGRQAARSGHTATMHTIFHAHMTHDQPRAALAEATAHASARPACLLCFERDHHACHRALVADMISATTGQPIHHLQPAA